MAFELCYNISQDKQSEGEIMATERAIFAGGCFWCTETIFESIKTPYVIDLV